MPEPSLQSQIRIAVAESLGTSDPESIDGSEDLRAIGLDSLASAELSDCLLDEFGIDPIPNLESLTIDQLIAAISSRRMDVTHDVPEAVDDRPTMPRTLTPVVAAKSQRLVIDDYVPTSILLVLAYQADLTHAVAPALQFGLNAYPHFSGRIVGATDPFDLCVEPNPEGVALEWNVDDRIDAAAVANSSDSQLIDTFLPSTAGNVGAGLVRSPLLAVRTTRLGDGSSVVGLMVSHALVDGVGLTLFLMTCASGLAKRKPPSVQHDRQAIAFDVGTPIPLPPWYAETSEASHQREWDLAKECEVCVFSIPDERLGSRADVDPSISPWFALTAFLCSELYSLGNYTEVAMWCDVRGQLSIPRNYTGNVGCYWHEPIGDDDESRRTLAHRLRNAVSGNQSHVETYRAIRQRQNQGLLPRWMGTEPHVLPVNLLPFSLASLDLGVGPPTFARLLTRNLHGLRISRSPSDAAFVVEACLPDPLAASLLDRCRDLGLAAQR